MKLNYRIAAFAGALALAAATHVPSASAHGAGFAVTVGVPGIGFTVGNYGAPYGGYYGTYYAPGPVAVAPPVPYYYRPYRPYYAPVIAPAPYPVVRPYGYAAAWSHRQYNHGHAVHVRGPGHRPY